MTDPSSLRKLAKARGLKLEIKGNIYSLAEGPTRVWGPGLIEEARAFLLKVEPLRRAPRGTMSPQAKRLVQGIRKLARTRGFQVQIANGMASFFKDEIRVFGPAPLKAAEAHLCELRPRQRGRLAAPSLPRPQVERARVTSQDYTKARRIGDYVMKVELGVIRLWAGDKLVFESRDVSRLRLFFLAAKEGRVPVGPKIAAQRQAKFIKSLEAAAKVDARVKAAAARRKARAAKSRAAKMPQALKPGDPGEASADFTPRNYKGLVETRVWLPDGISGDAALIGLWAAENHNPWSPAKSVLAKIAAAELALAGRVNAVEITLSDHDRASLQRYGVPVNVALAAAAMSRAQSRTR